MNFNDDFFKKVEKKTKVNKNVAHHLVNIKHKDIVDAIVNFLKIQNPYFTLIFASEKAISLT